MEEENLFAKWMNEEGYTSGELAREMGVGYELVYKFAGRGRKVTDGFKWLFFKRFGPEAAARAFGEALLYCEEESDGGNTLLDGAVPAG